MQEIKITLTKNKKPLPDMSTVTFGTVFTDHMFVMDYDKGEGWHDPRIEPYAPFELMPSASVLHYSQTLFEGLKAYYDPNGEIRLFRPQRNFARLNSSGDRICVPHIDEEFALEALLTLVDIERRWVPKEEGQSLYIRPFVISMDQTLGVHPATHFRFFIILCPVASYYKGGLAPTNIMVEPKYVRAVKGGTGHTKIGGNYAASLKGQEEAARLGYEQVLWLDGIHHKYVEEVGSMNIMFKIGGKIVTPELNGSILPGVTRDSIITIAKSLNIPVVEKRIAVDEIFEAADNGTLEEVFGTGTAAVISPVGELRYDDKIAVVNDRKIGPTAQLLYDTLTGIQYGKIEDKFGWSVIVPKK
ncbi:MAG: branched-chain amino acid aminotransferase [Bacillota bacterium]|nr:branched-chain amino acid aminotransferase [Bacillota bacterium]